MEEKPYNAPQEKPLVAPAAKELGRRYESVGQRCISVALLLFVFIGPLGVAILANYFSTIRNADAMSYSINLGALTWLGAIVWLIYRVIRRHHKSAPLS
jgi:hypothetical protein